MSEILVEPWFIGVVLH